MQGCSLVAHATSAVKLLMFIFAFDSTSRVNVHHYLDCNCLIVTRQRCLSCPHHSVSQAYCSLDVQSRLLCCIGNCASQAEAADLQAQHALTAYPTSADQRQHCSCAGSRADCRPSHVGAVAPQRLIYHDDAAKRGPLRDLAAVHAALCRWPGFWCRLPPPEDRRQRHEIAVTGAGCA